jgi:MerR family transcriptional regulator, copper efflux regulator
LEPITSGQLAGEAGIGVEMIRSCWRRGLIPEPPRTASGYRQDPSDIVDRVRFIQRAKEPGFALSEIKESISLGLHE